MTATTSTDDQPASPVSGSDGPRTPDDGRVAASRSRFAELTGFTLGVGGFFAFAVTLETITEKLAAVVASVSLVAVAWRALRDRAGGKLTDGMLITLTVATGAMLVLVMVVDSAGGRPEGPGGDATRQPPAPSRTATSSPTFHLPDHRAPRCV